MELDTVFEVEIGILAVRCESGTVVCACGFFFGGKCAEPRLAVFAPKGSAPTPVTFMPVDAFIAAKAVAFGERVGAVLCRSRQAQVAASVVQQIMVNMIHQQASRSVKQEAVQHNLLPLALAVHPGKRDAAHHIAVTVNAPLMFVSALIVAIVHNCHQATRQGEFSAHGLGCFRCLKVRANVKNLCRLVITKFLDKQEFEAVRKGPHVIRLVGGHLVNVVVTQLKSFTQGAIANAALLHPLLERKSVIHIYPSFVGILAHVQNSSSFLYWRQEPNWHVGGSPMQNCTEVRYSGVMTENNEENPQIDVERLNELLEEKNPPWRAPELAQYAKIPYDTAYAIIKGRRTNPQSSTLNAIADALKVTPDYLLGKSNHRKPIQDKLPDLVRQLTRVAGRLSEIRQRELIKIAETLEDLERQEPVYSVPAAAVNSLLELLESLDSVEKNAETYTQLRNAVNSMLPGFLGLRGGKDNGQPL